MSGRRAAEVQKLYLSGTRNKCPCSAGTRRADVIGKTRAGKSYLLGPGRRFRRPRRQCRRTRWRDWPVRSAAAARDPRRVDRAFPADRGATLQPEAFDDAGEIVGPPAVTQDEGDRDGLRIPARREVPRMRAKEIVEAFVDVELLDQEFQQVH